MAIAGVKYECAKSCIELKTTKNQYGCHHDLQAVQNMVTLPGHLLSHSLHVRDPPLPCSLSWVISGLRFLYLIYITGLSWSYHCQLTWRIGQPGIANHTEQYPIGICPNNGHIYIEQMQFKLSLLFGLVSDLFYKPVSLEYNLFLEFFNIVVLFNK